MDFIEKRFEVELISNIVFGSANVDYRGGEGPMRERVLRLDCYKPKYASDQPLPALILAFGGAFHRGSKEDDTVVENGHSNTPIAEYCARFAARGYVCFSIDYRLAQEDPDPGSTLILGDEDVPRSRIDHVRRILGLEPSTAEMIRNVQEAGIDDMAMAFRFVKDQSATYGVDPDRIAVGGFSAGGRIAMNAALGDDITPAAVVALSAYVPGIVMDAFASRNIRPFPVFVGHGEADLEYVLQQTPVMSQRFAELGIPCSTCMVPGGSHFYPASAPVVFSHEDAKDLETAIASFLNSALASRLTAAAE
jgi:dienelactone hydrolase